MKKVRVWSGVAVATAVPVVAGGAVATGDTGEIGVSGKSGASGATAGTSGTSSSRIRGVAQVTVKTRKSEETTILGEWITISFRKDVGALESSYEIIGFGMEMMGTERFG